MDDFPKFNDDFAPYPDEGEDDFALPDTSDFAVTGLVQIQNPLLGFEGMDEEEWYNHDLPTGFTEGFEEPYDLARDDEELPEIPLGGGGGAIGTHPWKVLLTGNDDDGYEAQIDPTAYSALFPVALSYSGITVDGMATVFEPIADDFLYLEAEYDFDGALVGNVTLLCGSAPTDFIEIDNTMTPILWQKYFRAPIATFAEVEGVLQVQQIVNSQLKIAFTLYNGLPCRFPLPIG